MSNAPFDQVEAELAKLPPALLDTYREAVDGMTTAFSDEELTLWAKEGVTIATQTVRSWEAAVEY